MGSIEEFLKSAEEFINLAFKEFEEASKEKNNYRLRDAAEKAWNAVIQATNALAVKRVGQLPKTHYERRIILKNLEKEDLKLREIGIYDRYAARSRLLHGEIFYEGLLDLELLKLEIEKAKEYVELIKKVL